jgi:anti-sigma factor RsiW
MDVCSDDALKLDYENGLLSEKERALFEAHLAACPACRGEVAGIRRTAAAIAGLTPPSVPPAWTAAAKARLRAKSLVPARRRTNVFQYAAITAGVTAGLALLFWLVAGGAAERWLPGLSAYVLGISDPRAGRTVELVAWVLSLSTLLLVPSIIEDIYQLVRRGGRHRPRQK